MDTAADLAIDKLAEGMTFSFDLLVTDQMIDDFAELSGDRSPIVTDGNFAKAHGFARRLAHGALINAFISRLIGMRCPGRLALLHSLNIEYHRPTYPGDEITISGVVEHISESTKTITLQLEVSDKGNQKMNARGQAQVGFLK